MRGAVEGCAREDGSACRKHDNVEVLEAATAKEPDVVAETSFDNEIASQTIVPARPPNDTASPSALLHALLLLALPCMNHAGIGRRFVVCIAALFPGPPPITSLMH